MFFFYLYVGISFCAKFADASTDTARTPDICFEDIKEDDAKVRIYTGFVNSATFMLVFNTVPRHGADKLAYWEGGARSSG